MAVDDLSQEFLRVLLEHGGDADTTTIRSETGMSRGQVNHRYRKLDDLGWIEISRAEEGAGERTPPKVAILTEEGKQAIRSGDAGKQVLGKEVNDEDDEIKVSKEQLESFSQEIDGMKNQLNVVVEQLNGGGGTVTVEGEVEGEQSGVSEERVQNLEREVSRLRETVEMLNQAVSEQRKAEKERREREDELLSQVEETVEEKVEEMVEERVEQRVEERLEDMEQAQQTGMDLSAVQELRDEQDYLKDWMEVAERHMLVMRLFMEDNEDVNMEEYFKRAEEIENR